jgi:O-acetyl-ADP-ribose deacetylase (regulator of RNase III)
MKRIVKGRTITLRQGDITDAKTAAIVNAANQYLAGGGGVDGAIHRAGGPSIMAECRRIGGCPTGDAVATGAGNLIAKHVIHAVAPIWRGGHGREVELLSSAYRRSLETAEQLGDTTVTFPSLGTGAYGYPVDQAAHIALHTVADYLTGQTQIGEVTFVLFSERDLETYRQALEELA